MLMRLHMLLRQNMLIGNANDDINDIDTIVDATVKLLFVTVKVYVNVSGK